MNKIRIGISGWTFDGWRDSFYPAGLKSTDELAFASRSVSSIEVNGTFHSLFRPANYQNWYEQTPSDFIFALKGPKYITHERRLKEFQTPLSNFLASGLLALGEKLGPILWQFPPNLPFTAERFAPFLASLPHDMFTAAKLGTGHSTWLEGRTFLTPPVNHRMYHAIEGRHPSFKSREFVDLARRHGIAIVVGDTAGRWPYMEDVTADFVYIRLHGDESKYPDGYTRPALEYWAERLQSWASGSQPKDAVLVDMDTAPPQPAPRPVFAYFDNDVKELAPVNATSMMTHLTNIGVIDLRIDIATRPRPVTAKKKAAGAPKTRAAKSASKVNVKRKPKSKTKAKRAAPLSPRRG